MPPLDLTLEISTELPSFPGSPRPRFISWATNKEDGYNLELIFLSSHSGTHINAPFHFIEKGLKINKIPLRRLVTNAILFKIKKRANEPSLNKTLLSLRTNMVNYSQIQL